MTSIYKVFPKDLIHVNDEYTEPLRVHELYDVFFEVGISNENKFLTPVGVRNGKIQSILNKQFYYIPHLLGGVSGTVYPVDLRNVYEKITRTNNCVEIEEPVFYCMDYESASGTGHSYDYMFYIAYIYKESGLQVPLAIPDVENTYFNNIINLIEEYLQIRFLRIKLNTTYRFRKLYAVRTYLNVFFPEVKEFLRKQLIRPIVEKYKDQPFYENIARLKIKPKGDIFMKNSVLEKTVAMEVFCSKHDIWLMDESLPEDLKIYYTNKAKTLIVCWGSIFYIYIDYYLDSTENKYISVLFHNAIMGERSSLQQRGEYVYQYMPISFQNSRNIYNELRFRGEVVDSVETFEDYLGKTCLNKI